MASHGCSILFPKSGKDGWMPSSPTCDDIISSVVSLRWSYSCVCSLLLCMRMARACCARGSFTLSSLPSIHKFHMHDAVDARLLQSSVQRSSSNLASRRFVSGSVKLQTRVSKGMRRGMRRSRVVSAIQWRDDDGLPTQEEIVAAAKEMGINMELKTTGPLFTVTATDPAGEELGASDGFIKPWIDCNILHLDSIRLTKASATRSGRSIFGAGVYMGALMVRHGIDCACERGELLAINDTDEYHKKLVRYYSRLGWRPVYEVKGDSWRDYIHMLVWGGVGTRMDADLRELLGKWASTLKPDSKKKSSSQMILQPRVTVES